MKPKSNTYLDTIFYSLDHINTRKLKEKPTNQPGSFKLHLPQDRGSNPLIHEWVTKIRNNCSGSFDWIGNNPQILQTSLFHTSTVMQLPGTLNMHQVWHILRELRGQSCCLSQHPWMPPPDPGCRTPSIHPSTGAGAGVSNARPQQRLWDVPHEFCSLHTPAHPHICSCKRQMQSKWQPWFIN